MKVALHTCCGPCASACLPRLMEEGHDTVLVFANSNIADKEEFELRRREAEKLAINDRAKFITIEYDHEDWLREVAAGLEDEPERGKRCERCFRYSLKKVAQFAAANGLDAFTTSLTVSPHKNSSTIFACGQESAKEQGSTFLEKDFKKKGGFLESTRRAKELNMYRQKYCGCEFSRRGRMG
ncbi:MAG: epoxyqueuosine reductase QueH [Kiritimatiellae bacterium]|nr:epoxyqueuosine reductase QueH [Kiritimatiellia bacterium]